MSDPVSSDISPALSPFAHVLHAEVVRALADSRSYERGEAYVREGRVSPPLRLGSRLEARVRGSTKSGSSSREKRVRGAEGRSPDAIEYDVSLWVKGDGLAYSCSCPHAAEGAFCKHCVAVALAWLQSWSRKSGL